MTQILALTKQQSDLLQKEMPENVVQLQDKGSYILTSITLTDSVDMLKLFMSGIIHGLNLTK